MARHRSHYLLPGPEGVEQYHPPVIYSQSMSPPFTSSHSHSKIPMCSEQSKLIPASYLGQELPGYDQPEQAQDKLGCGGLEPIVQVHP